MLSFQDRSRQVAPSTEATAKELVIQAHIAHSYSLSQSLTCQPSTSTVVIFSSHAERKEVRRCSNYSKIQALPLAAPPPAMPLLPRTSSSDWQSRWLPSTGHRKWLPFVGAALSTKVGPSFCFPLSPQGEPLHNKSPPHTQPTLRGSGPSKPKMTTWEAVKLNHKVFLSKGCIT